MKNFTNGSLVFRLWQFDGSGEIIGKFQYFSDAQDFARMKANEDREKRPCDSIGYFYLACCDAENDAKAFFPIQPKRPYESNSRLVAASPDLLAAQTMGAQVNTPDFLDWLADRLIHQYGESPNVDFVHSLRDRAKAGRAAIAKATGAA